MDNKRLSSYRLYLSLLNLLRLRGLKLKDKDLIDNNNAIMDKLKDYSSPLDYSLVEYLYSYLYINFEKLYNSYIYCGNNYISILNKISDSDKITYTYNIITKVGDEEVPIKNEERIIVFDKKDNNYSACKNTYYSTANAIEMIKLETDKVYYSGDMGLSYITDNIDDETNIRVIFRNFYDYLLLTEVDMTKEDDKINYYETDTRDLTKIIKDNEVTLDEHFDNYGSQMISIRNAITHGFYPKDTLNSIDYLRYYDNEMISSILKSGDRFNNNHDNYVKESINYDKKIDVDLRNTLAMNKLKDADDVVDIMGMLEKRNKNRGR